jgi:cytosine/adenosine deaminase-related metal-dependent hydrolase
VRRRGIWLGLGTDTFPPDLVVNMHVGVLASRIKERSLRTSAADYYTAATIGGADALGRPDLGRLEPGALADIAIFDLSGHHLGQFVDPIQTLVLNGSGRDVRTVIVDGRTVVLDRQVPGVDLATLHERAQRQYRTLIASYPERVHLHPPIEEIFAPAFPVRRRPEA